MKKLIKKAVILAVIVLNLIVLSSCSLIMNDNDSEDFINGVYTEKIIESNFTVMMESYTVNFFGEKKNVRYSQGSGVIFSREELPNNGGYVYYLLTNNHVVYKRTGSYTHFDYLVQDCYGNLIDATVTSFNANYDLAIMSFKSEKDFKVLSLASDDPEVNDQVISIGQPLGVINAVTIGKVEKYVSVVFKDENGYKDENISNVTFDVVKHTGYINNGSSGGVLLNRNYEICGINYAAGVGEENPVCGYAIQISKVKEFLSENFIL